MWFDINGPCVLCGSNEELQLDHIDPQTKISHRIFTWSEERRLKELAKCRVLCWRCHKKKTATEQPKGEQKVGVKLTNQDIIDIRRTYKPGVRGCGYKALAHKYNVSHQTISRIIKRQKWKHI